jgi:acetylornithine/N-succinyldiaminopimelate aminotransferase
MGREAQGWAYEIVTFNHAFHGRTLATMSASKKPGWDVLFEPKVPGFPTAELNDLASVERVLGKRTVAVMLEPIQGEAGVIPASHDFLRALRKLTASRGVLLIVDEVQTGMGRTGTLFAHEQAGIEPDSMTLGKGLGGGVPLAALCAKEAVCVFDHGDQGGTYNGNPHIAAVGCAVMEAVCATGFLEHVRSMGSLLSRRLGELAARHRLGEVRGAGLLVALELGQPFGAKVVELAREQGLLLNSPRPATLRFMPALNVAPEEIESMTVMLDRVLTGTSSLKSARVNAPGAAAR